MTTDYPRHFVHIELSTKCALKCPRCPRTEMKGMYHVGELSLEFIKTSFDQIANEIEQINICGGQGDPIYNTQFLDIIRYFKGLPKNPHLKIITNGSYKSKEWWDELGTILQPNDTVTFSIDGWDDESNNKYRVGSDFDSILQGVKSMVNSKAIVRWSTIIFKFNQDKIKDIISLAKSLGIDSFDITKSALFGSKFFGYKDDVLGYDPLEPDEEYVSSFGGRWGKFTESLTGNRVYPPYKFDKEQFEERRNNWLDNYVIPICKCTGLLYIDVEGILYPCSWVSHPFNIKKGVYSGRRIKWSDNFWTKHKDEMNLHKNTFNEIMNSKPWKILEATWNDLDKCFLECENKCLNDSVEYKKLWRQKWGVK